MTTVLGHEECLATSTPSERLACIAIRPQVSPMKIAVFMASRTYTSPEVRYFPRRGQLTRPLRLSLCRYDSRTTSRKNSNSGRPAGRPLGERKNNWPLRKFDSRFSGEPVALYVTG